MSESFTEDIFSHIPGQKQISNVVHSLAPTTTAIQQELNAGRDGHFYKTNAHGFGEVQMQLIGYTPSTKTVTVNYFSPHGVFYGYYKVPIDRLDYLQYLGPVPVFQQPGSGRLHYSLCPHGNMIAPKPPFAPYPISPNTIINELNLGRQGHFYESAALGIGPFIMQLNDYNAFTTEVIANVYDPVYGTFLGSRLIPVANIFYISYKGPNFPL